MSHLVNIVEVILRDLNRPIGTVMRVGEDRKFHAKTGLRLRSFIYGRITDRLLTGGYELHRSFVIIQ